MRAIRPLAWTLSMLALWAAVSTAAADSGQITMNFKDAELESIVQFISELTGKNFILDEKVRGKITVISPGSLTADEAYEVFQAILNVKGFTIVPAGKVLKIVATREAKQTSIETVREPADPGDRYVTRILPLEHVEAETIAGIVSPLISKDSSIVAYAPTNTLILTDSYSNIVRLIDIISALDVETVDTVLEIIQLRYASVDAIAKNLVQVVTEKPARRRAPARGKGKVQVQAEVLTVKIIPDARTNSLIVIADPDTLEDIKAMIEALDVEIPKGTGKINVYYLKYADAENVASVLTAISKSAGTKARPGQPQKPTTTSTQVPVEFEEPVQVTADKATNSLVIIASPQDYEILRGVIEKLDIRRPQVLVEALIAEMDFDHTFQLGVDWRTTTDPNSDGLNVVAGSNFGTIGSLAGLATNPLAGPAGLFLGVIDGTIEVGGVTFPNVAAAVRAIQTDDDVNVLATPHLLTTDNEEAEIVVSDNIPFQTSEKFDSNGNPIFTFEYRDVGLTLRITPQINEDDYVKLKLFQEVSQVVSLSTGTNENAPSTRRRLAKTTVVAKDGGTIVIGGLIQDIDSVNVSSVPCLGDLPLLGYLFKFTSKERRKKNLLIFLTPHIIKSTEDIENVTRKKHEEFEEGLEKVEEETVSPSERLRRSLSDEEEPFEGQMEP